MNRRDTRRVTVSNALVRFNPLTVATVMALVINVFVMILSVHVAPSRRPGGLVCCNRGLVVGVLALCVIGMIVTLLRVNQRRRRRVVVSTFGLARLVAVMTPSRCTGRLVARDRGLTLRMMAFFAVVILMLVGVLRLDRCGRRRLVLSSGLVAGFALARLVTVVTPMIGPRRPATRDRLLMVGVVALFIIVMLLVLL
jgi:hypothetical protein